MVTFIKKDVNVFQESERQCFKYYDETVCKITKKFDGNPSPWVFVAILYCDHNVTDLGQ